MTVLNGELMLKNVELQGMSYNVIILQTPLTTPLCEKSWLDKNDLMTM
jgi:hypothetical protein